MWTRSFCETDFFFCSHEQGLFLRIRCILSPLVRKPQVNESLSNLFKRCQDPKGLSLDPQGCSIGKNCESFEKRIRNSVADLGFPVGGVDLVGGRGLPRWLCFENFVYWNERIWTLRGACAGHAPLDPPMEIGQFVSLMQKTLMCHSSIMRMRPAACVAYRQTDKQTDS